MKLQHTIGDKEKAAIIIERNCFTGSLICRENNKVHCLSSPWNLNTHLYWQLSREFDLEVGEEERHSIKIIHSRPRWFPGFRHQTIEVFANGKLLEKHIGY